MGGKAGWNTHTQKPHNTTKPHKTTRLQQSDLAYKNDFTWRTFRVKLHEIIKHLTAPEREKPYFPSMSLTALARGAAMLYDGSDAHQTLRRSSPSSSMQCTSLLSRNLLVYPLLNCGVTAGRVRQMSLRSVEEEHAVDRIPLLQWKRWGTSCTAWPNIL